MVVRHAFEVRVCKSSEDYDINQATCKILDRNTPNVDRHAECLELLDLRLLLTSRQIYSEARWEPFIHNRFAVSCDRVSKIDNPGAYSDLPQSERRDSRPLYWNCGMLLSAFLKNRLMPSQIKAIANMIIEEACDYEMYPSIAWSSSVQGLNRLQSLDIRINGLLDDTDDLSLLLRSFRQDFRRQSLLRRQEHCQSVRVSLELYTGANIAFPPKAVVSTQSCIQVYASALARQTRGKRDEMIAQQKIKHANRRSAIRQKLRLRPL
jgi:hypothetical protein